MSQRAGFFEIASCGLVWGSIGVITRKVPVGAPAVAFFRVALGCVAVVAFFALRGRLSELRLRDQRFTLFADGAILGLHWLLMFLAFKHLSVATAVLIVFLGPVFVAAGVGRLLDERLEPSTLLSLAFSLAGVALITIPAWRVRDALGLASALGSAVMFGALVIANKRLTRSYRPPAILAWQLGVAALVVAPFFVASPMRGLGSSMPGLVTLAVVHTALTGVLYFRGLTMIKAQYAGVLAYLEPASAVLYAWLFLNERPAALTLIGGALVLGGGLNLVLRRKAATPLSEPAVASLEP